MLNVRFREIARWLRIKISLAEDPSLGPTAHQVGDMAHLVTTAC